MKTSAHQLIIPAPMQAAIYDDTARGTGHTMVLARAGAGKTTALITALSHVPAGASVLLVAFNKSIASELKARAPKGVDVATAHSFGYKICLRSKVRLDADRLPKLIDETMNVTRDEKSALVKVVSFAKGMLANTESEIETAIVRSGVDLDIVEKCGRFIDRALALLDDCRECEDNVIDFDDMVWLPLVKNLRVPQYDRIFVDEMQDFNDAQIELALRACKKNGRICGFGDDRQAIYGFRGAGENVIERITERLGAKTLPLSVTYRCARSVVKLANRVVRDLEAAPNAPEGIVRQGTKAELLKSVRPGDFVLSRTNAPLVEACLALLAAGKRANIQGRDMGKALIAFVERSKKKTVDSLRDYVDAWSEKECARLVRKNPDADIQAIIDRRETLLALSDGCETVEAVLERLRSLFSTKSDEEAKGDTSVILLSSTHRAKGLERDRVWMLEDTFMKRDSIEEENLFYVAVTRAKRELVLVRWEEASDAESAA